MVARDTKVLPTAVAGEELEVGIAVAKAVGNAGTAGGMAADAAVAAAAPAPRKKEEAVVAVLGAAGQTGLRGDACEHQEEEPPRIENAGWADNAHGLRARDCCEMSRNCRVQGYAPPAERVRLDGPREHQQAVEWHSDGPTPWAQAYQAYEYDISRSPIEKGDSW